MNKPTLEQSASDALLQSLTKIKIADKDYEVAPPSVATLILASAAISTLPKVSLDSENIASQSLSIAQDCEPIGDILAILILGAKGVEQTATVRRKGIWGFLGATEQVKVDQKRILAKKILQELPPSELHELMAQLLGCMQLGDFFGLTASLLEVNLLRETRGAVTTVSGR